MLRCSSLSIVAAAVAAVAAAAAAAVAALVSSETILTSHSTFWTGVGAAFVCFVSRRTMTNIPSKFTTTQSSPSTSSSSSSWSSSSYLSTRTIRRAPTASSSSCYELESSSYSTFFLSLSLSLPLALFSESADESSLSGICEQEKKRERNLSDIQRISFSPAKSHLS